MYALLIVVHIIASIVLIMVILLQAGRGGGLSESFGFSSTQTLFGTSATKFLQRATSVCAVVFLITCLSLAGLSTRRSRSLMERQRVKQAIEEAAKNQKTNAVPEQAKAAAAAKTAAAVETKTASAQKEAAPAANAAAEVPVKAAEPVVPVEKK